MESASLPVNLLICMLAAVLAVPGSRKLGLGSVPGYLVAGIVVGPWGLALIREASEIDLMAEIGMAVVFFLVGLELRPELLIRLKARFFWLGSSQLLLTAIGIFAIGLLLQRTWYESLLAALALSLSSHTVAMQFLDERNLLPSAAGQTIYSILLFQALVVLPIVLLIPVLGYGNPLVERVSIGGFFETLVVVMVVLGCGHYILRHGYRYITDLGSHEMFMAATGVFMLTIVLIMMSFGQPLGLGVFLCGVLMADSEFFRKIDTDIEPFRGVALGLFFIVVGLNADLGLLLQRPSEVLGLILSLLLLKSMVLYVVARMARVPLLERPLTSLLMAQSGEFSFILLSMGASFHVIPERLESMLTVVVMLSMLATPVVMIWVDRYLLTRKIRVGTDALPVNQEPVDTVVIAGFGRFGQIVARLLKTSGIGVTVIDHNPAHLAMIRDLGFNIIYGDARRPKLMAEARADKAKVLIVAVDDQEHALEITRMVHAAYPDLRIVARAWDRLHHWQLTREGAHFVQRETFESAVLTGEDVLSLLGRDFDEVERVSEAFRDHDERLLRELSPVEETSQKMIKISAGHSVAAREELMRLIDEDAEQKELERRVQNEERDTEE